MYSIAAQLACSVLAYAMYRQSQTVVIGVGVAVGVAWLVLLGSSFGCLATVAVDPALADMEA